MSIESHTSAPGANLLVEHYCCVDGCSKWGGFGFAASKNVETRWWCWEHYPHKRGGQKNSGSEGTKNGDGN